MAVVDAPSSEDKAESYILACQAKIQSDVKVDARGGGTNEGRQFR
jgi:ferredoxin